MLAPNPKRVCHGFLDAPEARKIHCSRHFDVRLFGDRCELVLATRPFRRTSDSFVGSRRCDRVYQGPSKRRHPLLTEPAALSKGSPAAWTGVTNPVSLREKLNSPLGIAAVVIAVIATTVMFAVMARRTLRGVDHYEDSRWLYFMDEQTHQLSIRPFMDVSPQPNASGSLALVRACFFSTDDGKTKQLIYLMKYSDEGKKQVEAARLAGQSPSMMNSHLTPDDWLMRAAEDGSPWVPENSSQARALRARANNLAGPEGYVIECYPKSPTDKLPVLK